ncbi:Phosphoglycerate kinase [Methanoregula boonei 6A8]|uniref:Phosphoglycerate kinase n=1 Tax=Methanoregula boonei (strain DSM 21154 / JCM 14090 / 6A8) TaxID=456442 RepID=A7I8J6_METB6|nr:phosphoglycerate kinase [Methanoregula boonei]ABS56057.1 Phosphoglycerate kinase [Methanoregula boonei 6A8]
MQKKTVEDEEVYGKRVLVRADFNVPMDRNGTIEDDTRIRACLPTITYLIDHRARIILCSHLGRPQGRVDGHLRLEPVARRLSELLQRPVKPLREAIGPEVERAVSGMENGEIILLENLRFYPGDEENDPGFARELASLADLFVNDAFGASHRAHASVVGLAAYLPCVAGLLMEKEIERLGSLLENPRRPFAAIMGGAKVEEKIGILENIISKVDLILIGGGMSATFLKGQGWDAGISPVEPDKMEIVRAIMQKAGALGVRILLPQDVIVTEKLKTGAIARGVSAQQIPADSIIADIGPQTITEFTKELKNCRTVVWNGPMGVFEIPQFSEGTKSIATALADLHAMTIVGGGSTAEAVTKLGLSGKMTHVSTGGGATLLFLSGKILPGIAVLADKE